MLVEGSLNWILFLYHFTFRTSPRINRTYKDLKASNSERHAREAHWDKHETPIQWSSEQTPLEVTFLCCCSNPEETSPEVQNRGISGPTKGLMSFKNVKKNLWRQNWQHWQLCVSCENLTTGQSKQPSPQWIKKQNGCIRFLDMTSWPCLRTQMGFTKLSIIAIQFWRLLSSSSLFSLTVKSLSAVAGP